MELRHLRYFVAVAEELHFRRAADRLHIAQPAVSEQIRKLESELGVKLLERTKRSVTLTPPGATLLVEARRILHLADEARRLTQQAHAGMLGRLRVGRPADVLPTTVTHALRRFTRSYPDVDLAVEQSDPRAAIEAIRQDLLDVALVCLPAPVAGLAVTPIGDEGVIVATADSHPRSGQAALPLAQLDGTSPIVLPREANPPFYDGLVAAAREAGITMRLSCTPAPTVEQALLAASAGRAPALLPASVANRHVAPGVRFMPLAEPSPRTPVALVTAGGAEHLHATRFVQLVLAMSRPRSPVMAAVPLVGAAA